MKFRVANRQDFFAGVFFMVVGIATLIMSSAYRVGTAGRMGPGYFPLMLGGILTILGIVIALQGIARVKEDVPLPPLSLRPLLMVLVPVALFGLLLNALGFVLCTVLLIGISSLAYYEPRWKEIAVSAVVLTAGSVLVFGYGLKLQFPLWPGVLGWN
jgi:hypothetical protein